MAIGLLEADYAVVLAGRRQALLEQAVLDAGVHGAHALDVPTDVGDPDAVRALLPLQSLPWIARLRRRAHTEPA